MPIPLFAALFFNCTVDLNPDVIYEYVNGPKSVFGCGDRVANGALFAGVALQDERIHSVTAAFRNAAGTVGIDIEEYDRATLGKEPASNRGPDPRPCSGDDNRSLQCHNPLSLPILKDRSSLVNLPSDPFSRVRPGT